MIQLYSLENICNSLGSNVFKMLAGKINIYVWQIIVYALFIGP